LNLQAGYELQNAVTMLDAIPRLKISDEEKFHRRNTFLYQYYNNTVLITSIT